ncbi:MAG: flippase [Thermodesulforhabdaceae bacterium]
MTHSYIANLFAQIFGRGSSIVAQMIIFVVLARRAGPELLGQYAYFLTFVNVCATFADFGTTVTLAKDLPRFEGRERELYWGNVLLIRLMLALFVMIFASITLPFLPSTMTVALIIGIATIPFAASRIFDPVFQVCGKPWYTSLSTGIYGVSLVALSSPLIFFGKHPIWTLCLAYLAAQITYLVVAWKLSLKLLKPRFTIDKQLWRTHLKIAVPIGVSFVFTAINSRADTFLLAWMKGDRDVGLYNAIYKFVDMAALGAVLLTNPLIPILSGKKEEGFSKFRKTLLLFVLSFILVLAPVALLTPLFSESIVTLLYGEEFRETAKVLNIFAWVCVLIFLGLLSSTGCLVMDTVHFEWWNAAIAAALNITLNLYLIPSYGYLGSAWATLASEVWIVGVTAFFMFRGIIKSEAYSKPYIK